MAQDRTQNQTQFKNDALTLSIDPLRRAVNANIRHADGWVKQVEVALGRVVMALREHRAAGKAPDGILAEVDETRPTLARQADDLRTDHDAILKMALALWEALRRTNTSNPGTSAADLNIIRLQTQELLDDLEQNKEAETQLVLDSINTNIGVGD